MVSDFIDCLTLPLSLESINNKFEIKMNFLEYVNIFSLIKIILNGKTFQKLE